MVLHYKTSESLTITSASPSPEPTVSLQAEQRCWRAALLPTLALKQAQDWPGERAGGSGCGGLWCCHSSRGMWSEEVHCLAASTSIFFLWVQTVSLQGFSRHPTAHFSPGTRGSWAEMLGDRDVLLLTHSPLYLLCVILSLQFPCPPSYFFWF